MKDLIKKIRESRGLKKIDVYTNIVSKNLYTKIEEDLYLVKFDDLLLILQRLDISFMEFTYILNTHLPDFRTDFLKDMRNLFVSSNSKELDILISKYKIIDQKSYNLLLSIKYISENNLEKANEQANLVWNQLKDYDTYYPNDVFYLSHIFYLFPLKEGLTIINILKDLLSKWNNYENFIVTEASFYLNAGRYIHEIDIEKEKAIEYYYKALDISVKNDLAKYTGISLIRIGHFENDYEKLKNGKTILKIFDPNILKVILNDIEKEDL